MIPSIHITSIRSRFTRNNDHTNLGAWFLACLLPVLNTMSVVSSWFYAQLAELVCGCGSMREQSWWLRSIDIISGCNLIQAASNNKYVDKAKYKWAVNMYECLTVDLFNLHPPMALNANSFGFHMVSCKYMQIFMIVWNNFTMQHEIECHNCCMNGRNLWIIHIPSSSPILDVPTFEQCNLSSRTNQSRTSTSINPFLVNFNRPTCGTQEIVSLPTSQQLGRIRGI